MSKQAIGWGCALVAFVGFSLMGKLVAQQQSDDPFASKPASSVPRSVRQVEDKEQNAEQRIKTALDQRLKAPLNYEEEPLNIILNTIANEYNLPIVFDKAALDEVAISPESEVTINLRNISLRAALNLMFKEPGLEELCYVIDEEVLLITTEEKANEKLGVRVYRVDDLIESSSRRNKYNRSSRYGDPEHLIELFVGSIEVDSWTENGTGEGEMQFYPPGMLVISQTERVHVEIEKLLNKLRLTKQQILNDASTTASATKPITLGFAIDVELGKNPEQTQKQIAAAIKSSVDWSEGELAESETLIEMLPDRVLVRHLPTVLNQVEIVLVDMQLVKNSGGGIGGGRGGGGGIGGGEDSGGGGGGGGGFF